MKLDPQGLFPALVQDRTTGEIRMVAWMNDEALARTLATGRATFYSRSRGALWVKGESSGHVLHVHEAYVDCDEDTLLLLVDPVGPSCHTGEPSCFFRRLGDDGAPRDERVRPRAFLERLEQEIASRRSSSASKSYTKSLLDGGAPAIGAKLREEAGELADAIATESDARVASEAADVVYHLLVGLASRGVAWQDVVAELGRRSGASGHAEKASRAPKPSE
jgi:phosphoribosyl-ATP pyrophosphohydrolase/phosphoribosyl-AMP cyclohydrolase